MRDFLDAILAFIGSESLTDLEFDSIELEEQSYTQETYDVLKAILEAREEVTTQLDKLVAYFNAKGVDVEDTDSTPKSKIYLGDVL